MWNNIEINSIVKTPLYIVDIGASGGLSPRYSNITSHYKAILFEPNPEEFEKLKSIASDKQIILNSGLSDRSGEVNFYLCKKQQVSSMFVPNYPLITKYPDPERFNIVKNIKIDTDTLDNQLLINNISNVDFIKVDTQGSELLILKGGGYTLKQVIGLEVEVEFVQIYENQPLFTDVNEYIKGFGFSLFDLKRYFWKRKDVTQSYIGKGQIVCADALYFRVPENICILPGIDEDKIVHSICLFLAYGYDDMALTLCDLVKDKKIMSESILKKITLMVKKHIEKDCIPYFKGRSRVYNLLSNILDYLAPRTFHEGSDRKLGN